MAQQIVSTSAPWEPQQPFLTYGFDQAKSLYGQGGPQYYPDSTVAQFGADTTGAMGTIRNLATQGTAVPGAATNQIASTLQGDYLNSNPYLDAMYNNAASRVTENYREAVAPSIAANFGMSGRSGSNMAFANTMQNSQQQLADSLGGMAANIYGQNYANERNNQMQAAQMAPSIAPLSYYDAQQQLNVGNMMDAKAQQNIQDQFDRFMFNQERPYDNLGRYMGYIGGGYGNTQTGQHNSLAENLGLGLTGAGLANQLFPGLLGGLFGTT